MLSDTAWTIIAVAIVVMVPTLILWLLIYLDKKTDNAANKLLQPPYFTKTSKLISSNNLIMKGYSKDVVLSGIKDKFNCNICYYTGAFEPILGSLSDKSRFTIIYQKEDMKLPHIMIWKRLMIVRRFKTPVDKNIIGFKKYASFDKTFVVAVDKVSESKALVESIIPIIDKYGEVLTMEFLGDTILIATTEAADIRTAYKYKNILDNTSKIARKLSEHKS